MVIAKVFNSETDILPCVVFCLESADMIQMPADETVTINTGKKEIKLNKEEYHSILITNYENDYQGNRLASAFLENL